MLTTTKWLKFPSLVALAVMALTASAAAQAPSDDDDEREFRRREAARSVTQNCMICHSAELIESQRLTPKQWAAEVEKMVGWGSPLPPEQRESVTAYLAEAHPATASAVEPARLVLADADRVDRPEPAALTGSAGNARAGAPLFAANCANCHGPDGQGAELGPNLVEKPVLLQPAAFASLLRQGRNRMPALAPVLDDKAAGDVLAWLRDRHYRPISAPAK